MAIAINGTGTVTGVSTGGISDTKAVAVTAMPAGSVLQVVSTEIAGNITSNSSGQLATGLITTVTPKQAGSKFYITVDGITGHANVTTVANYGARYFMYVSVNGGTYANAAAAHIGSTYINGNIGQWLDFPASMGYCDTPSYSLGQTVAYQPYYEKGQNTTSDVYFNHVGGNGNNQRVTQVVMEIAQ